MIYNGRARTLRLLAGFQITMILLTVTYKHYPNIVILKNGGYLSLLENRGADKTIEALGVALLIGSLFILPALIYLIYSFQKRGFEEPDKFLLKLPVFKSEHNITLKNFFFYT